jgi:opacity protein-like surface antigen
MRNCLYLLSSVVFTSLGFTTLVNAEEVSYKASDLTAINTSNQNLSNLLAQSSERGFDPTPSGAGFDQPILPTIPTEKPFSHTSSKYWYGGASVGFGYQSNVGYKQNDQSLSSINLGSISFDSPFFLNGAIGYQFDQARAEIEVGNMFLSAKESVAENTGFKEPLKGNINTTTVFLNGYFDISTNSKFRPYLGGGIGLGFTNGIISGNTVNSTAGSTFDLDVKNTSVIYQAKLGLQYEIVPKGNIFAEFKYGLIPGYKVSLKSGTQSSNLDLESFNSFGLSIGYRQGF